MNFLPIQYPEWVNIMLVSSGVILVVSLIMLIVSTVGFIGFDKDFDKLEICGVGLFLLGALLLISYFILILILGGSNE